MIKIATAECFTHGKIGLELHALAQNYEGNFGSKYIENLRLTVDGKKYNYTYKDKEKVVETLKNAKSGAICSKLHFF